MPSPNSIDKRVRYMGIPGSVWLLLALAAGMVLGAALYARLAAVATAPPPANPPEAESAGAPDAGASAETVQISLSSQKEVGIAFEPATVRSLQRALSATGTVNEDPSRVAHVRTLARGLIEKIYARLGDRVSAGDPLVEYDNIELGIALNEYLGAMAEQQRSQTELDVRLKILQRSQALLKAGALAQTLYDLREAEVRDAEAKVVGAQAAVAKFAGQIHRFGWSEEDLDRLHKSQQASRHHVSHSLLRAPFQGIVTGHHAVESEVVAEGTELMTITDMSSVWVLADVYEKDLSLVRVGQPVRIRIPSYSDETFGGQITYIADMIDTQTRTAKVRCLVSNRRGLLKLEMFATVEIPLQQSSRLLAVPSSSLQQIDGQPVVFVRRSKTEFERRKVQIGSESQGFTEIQAGLEAGEVVVSQGSFIVKATFLKHLIEEHEG